jgi:hypothetical protein
VGSNPVESNEFLRNIKICSTTSFGGDIKLSAQFCKILQHVKYPLRLIEILIGKIQWQFLTQILLGSLPVVSAATTAQNPDG